MKLRPYQEDLIKDLYQKLYKTDRCILVAPTGSGKTAITSHVLRDALSRARSAWFIVHRDELVTQTMATMLKVLPDAKIGVIKAQYKSNPFAPIQIASAQTLSHRKIYPDEGAVVIVDECHTTSFYKRVMEIIKGHRGFVIGVTATPWRTNKREGLSDHYKGQYVTAPDPPTLTEMGYLCRAKFYGFQETFDIKKVKTRAGDFAMDELSKACNTESSNEVIIKETKRFINVYKTGIAFCVDVKHALDLSVAFNQNGIKSEVVTGDTTKFERERIYLALSNGHVQIVTSVGVLTEGFDVPSIEMCILARPTKSKALNAQMVGRVLRPSEGKDMAIVLDFAGNHARHGLCTQMTQEEMAPDWVDTSPKGEAPTKECPECDSVVMAMLTHCPECGYKFPEKEKEREELDGSLVDLTEKQAKGGNPEIREHFGDCMMQAMLKNYSPKWPEMQVKHRFKRFPIKAEKWQATFSGDLSWKPRFWEYLKHKVGPEKAIKYFKLEYGNLKERT